MTFHSPVKVGDVVCCYGRCLKIGRSSMRLKLEVWVKPVLRENEAQRYCVTEGSSPMSPSTNRKIPSGTGLIRLR